MPGVFGIGQDNGHKSLGVIARHLIADLCGLQRLRLLLGVDERLRVATEQKIKNNDNDSAKSATHDEASAAARPADVFDVLALSLALPEHSLGS